MQTAIECTVRSERASCSLNPERYDPCLLRAIPFFCLSARGPAQSVITIDAKIRGDSQKPENAAVTEVFLSRLLRAIVERDAAST